MAGTLRLLYLHGRRLNWRPIYAGTGAQFLDCLPSYPLETSSDFVVPFREQEEGPVLLQKLGGGLASESQLIRTPYRFLSHPIQADQDGAGKVEFLADLSSMVPFIKAHQVGGMPLCPASVYIELALEACEATLVGDIGPCSSKPDSANFYHMSDICFNTPLVYNESRPAQDVTVSLHPESSASSGPYGFESGTFCTGRIDTLSQARVQETIDRKTAFVRRQTHSAFGQDAKTLDRFSARTIYRVLFPRVVTYSSLLETLSHLSVTSSGLEGHGLFRLPPVPMPPDGESEGEHNKRFVCHPALIDTMLHAAGFMANVIIDSDIACICSQVDQIMLLADSAQLHGQELSIYCDLVDVGHTMVGNSHVLDAQGRLVAWVDGMSFKKLSLKSFKRHLSFLSGGDHETPGQNSPKAQPSLTHTDEVTPLGTPAPATPVQQHEEAMQLPPVDKALRDMFLDIFGVHIGDVDHQQSIGALGVDSMGSIELLKELETRFAIRSLGQPDDLPAMTLHELEATIHKHISAPAAQHPAIAPGQIADAAAVPARTCDALDPIPQSRVDSPDESAWANFPMVIGTHTQGAIPLYLFHDGSGRCSMYAKLDVPGYNLFGIFSPRSDAPDNRDAPTLESLAALYIEKAGLRTKQRVILGGGSLQETNPSDFFPPCHLCC